MPNLHRGESFAEIDGACSVTEAAIVRELKALQRDLDHLRWLAADLEFHFHVGIVYYKYQVAEASFMSRESTNDLVNRVLEDNKATVDLVASGKKDGATLERRFGYVTGKEAFRPSVDSEPYVRNTYAVRVRIQHDLRSERGYRVLTAFPINPRRR